MRILLVVLVAACGSVKATTPQDASAHDSNPIDAAGSGSAGSDAATCVDTAAFGLGGRWRGEMNTTDDTGNSTGSTTGTSFSYVPGKHGDAFSFDGSTNAVEINDGDKLWPNASFTLELWVNTTSSGGDLMVKYQCALNCPANESQAFWALQLDGSGHADFALRTDAGANMIFTTDTLHDLRDAHWHHIVGVRDSTASSALLYVDGQLAASTALAMVDNGPMSNLDGEVDPITLGAGIFGGASTLQSFFGGAIDEVAYYSQALTASEIAAIYAAPDGECH